MLHYKCKLPIFDDFLLILTGVLNYRYKLSIIDDFLSILTGVLNYQYKLSIIDNFLLILVLWLLCCERILVKVHRCLLSCFLPIAFLQKTEPVSYHWPLQFNCNSVRNHCRYCVQHSFKNHNII